MPSLGLGLGLDKSQGVILAPEAVSWAAAVVAAGSSAPDSVVFAVSEFVKGCQADASPNAGVSNWDAMKVVQLLAGPDTFAGIAAPLKGDAATFNNFVSGDYDPATGLLGDGSTKYVDTNRAHTTDPQNNFSAWVYATEVGTSGFFGSGSGANGTTLVTNLSSRCRNDTATVRTVSSAGLVGVSRSASGSYNDFYDGSNTAVSQTSQSPFNGPFFVFATRPNNNVGASNYGNHRIAVYGIGEAVNFDLLMPRLSTLMAAIAAAHQ